MNVIEALLELEASNITSLVVGPLIGRHCGDYVRWTKADRRTKPNSFFFLDSDFRIASFHIF